MLTNSSDQSASQRDVEEPPPGADPLTRAQYAHGRWRAQDEHYHGLYRLWTRAILFLIGKQWFVWDGQQKRWTPEQNVPRWRQRPVTNLCFAVYRSAISKLTKQKPVFEVVPPSGDSEDREAASLSTALLEHLWRKLALTKLLKRKVGWLLTTASVYVRVDWDAEAGPRRPMTVPVQGADGAEIEVAATSDGDPIETGDGSYAPADEAESFAEGEVSVEIVPTFSVRLNPDAVSPDTAEEFFLGSLWPKHKAAKKFGIDPALLADAEGEELASFEDAIAGATSSATSMLGGGLGSDKSDAIGDRVLVLEYFRKPCDDYPEGRYWVQVGQVWAAEEGPVPHAFWPPVVAIEDLPVPGQPVGVGLLGQVIPLNEQHNTLTGHIREHQILNARGGKWVVVPEDKDLKITSDPTQVISSKGYLTGHPPFQAKIEALPNEVYLERERILSDLQIVSGLGEVGLSKKAEGTISGRSFLVQQEAVDSVLTPTLFEIEVGLEEVGRRMLVLAQERYREPRTIAIRGQQGQWEVRSFEGADLRDGMDVRVQTGSMFPWSKAAKLDTSLSIIQALPALVLNPDGATIDRQQLAKYLDVGGVSAFEPETDPDLQEIQREHAMFAEYDPEAGRLELPELGFWQDHAKHQAGHYSFLKTDMGRFRKWHPAAQQAFLQHTLQTTQAVQQMIASLAPESPQPAAGTGGGEGLGVEGEGAASQEGGPSDTQLQPADFSAAGV